VAFAAGALRDPAMSDAEAHLDRCDCCRQAAAALLSPAPRSAPVALGPTTFEPGQEVAGRYCIRSFIASGGMGEVYEVEDRELGEIVALKIVSATVSDDPRAARRLRAEVQLARRITHPGVCRIFDVGHCEQGLFATMELVAGESLGQRLRRSGPMSTGEVEPLLRQVLAGLTAAHEAGVIHRDLKSDNVMLCARAGQAPRAVVMDFGLARSMMACPGASSITSSTGGALGSAAYMAPEQVRGSGAVSPASDVYAVGVILHEALTGTLPFVGRTPAATAVMRLIVDPPSVRALRPGLEPRWERIILRCLERDPARRFRSAAELQAALDEPELPARRRTVTPALIADLCLVLVVLAVLALTTSGASVVG
jgi:serine/threonine protein kinase